MRFQIGFMALAISLVAQGVFAQGCDESLGVVPNEVLQALVKEINPPLETYIKDAPILVMPLPAKLSDIPAAIRDQLGRRDQKVYTQKDVDDNQGSVISLQIERKEGQILTDYYIISLSTYAGTKEEPALYQPMSLDDVAAKNKTVFDVLITFPGIKELADAGVLHGALKKEPVPMFRMSKIRFPPGKEVTIEDPWGKTQTKQANEDAWLVWDAPYKKYYMVNSDENGLPLTYVPYRK